MNLDLFPQLAAHARHQRRGVLSDRSIRELIARGEVLAGVPILDAQVQPSSLDLRLGEIGYEIRASVLPAHTRIEEQLERVRIRELRLDQPAVLEVGKSYLIPLVESLSLPSHIAARANPKSTTGRLDTVVRLLADYAPEVDKVPKGYRGQLFVEVSPRSFNLIARAGARLTQLRFLEGVVRPSDASLRRLSRRATLVYHRNGSAARPLISRGLHISVNLRAGADYTITGLQAVPNPHPIDVDVRDEYDPLLFWRPIEEQTDGTVLIEPNRFYLFSSVERICLPADHAAVMRPRNAMVGEFLFHYAGFFDPGYGYPYGAAAGLAIRSRWAPFYLRHDHILARLMYEPLREPSERLYGASLDSSYHARPFPLAKQFRTSGLFDH